MAQDGTRRPTLRQTPGLILGPRARARGHPAPRSGTARPSWSATPTGRRLDAADRRHRAEPRRPRRPDAPGVRVHPPDRPPARPAALAAGPAARPAPRRRGVDAGPLRRGHPSRLGAAGRRARRRAGRAGAAPAARGRAGHRRQVADARAGLAGSRAGSVDCRAARRLCRRPHPRAPDLGGVPTVVARVLRARTVLRRERRRRRARAPRASRSSQGAAPAAAFADVAVVASPDVLHGRRFGNVVLRRRPARLPVDELAARRRPTRSRHGSEPGDDFGVHRGGPHRRDGRPVAAPPAGLLRDGPAQNAPLARAWATLRLCSSNVAAKHEDPSVWQRHEELPGPSAGARAASTASFPGAAIGVGGRPATA